jgi:hypothetical protein
MVVLSILLLASRASASERLLLQFHERYDFLKFSKAVNCVAAIFCIISIVFVKNWFGTCASISGVDMRGPDTHR